VRKKKRRAREKFRILKFNGGRHTPVSGAAMENGEREAAMQPPTQPIKSKSMICENERRRT
jgi:hypothetical protein